MQIPPPDQNVIMQVDSKAGTSVGDIFLTSSLSWNCRCCYDCFIASLWFFRSCLIQTTPFGIKFLVIVNYKLFTCFVFALCLLIQCFTHLVFHENISSLFQTVRASTHLWPYSTRKSRIWMRRLKPYPNILQRRLLSLHMKWEMLSIPRYQVREGTEI